MIPDDRPVTGGDLKALKEKLGIDLREFCTVMGVAVFAYHKMTANLSEPVKDAALAVLVRWYDARPKDAPIMPLPSFNDLVAGARLLDPDITEAQVVTMLGRNFTSLYRYRATKKGNKQSKNANGAAKAIFFAFQRMIEGGGERGIKEWQRCVRAEARARGAKRDILDPTGVQRWPSLRAIGNSKRG